MGGDWQERKSRPKISVNSRKEGRPLAMVRLHLASQNFVHVGLMAFPTAAKPREHVRVDANADELFDGPVKAADINVGWGRLAFRRIGKVDLGIGLIGEFFEFPALLVTEGNRKEHVRGHSPFLPG